MAAADTHTPGATFPLAYVVLAHDNWPHLEHLVDRLASDPADSVFIHIDKRVPDILFERARDRIARDNVHFTGRVKCHWGHYSLVEATLIGLRALQLSGRPYRYVSLLSGSDYPIKPLSDFRAHLRAEEGKEFIEAYNMYFERWIRGGPYAERFEYVYPFPRFAYHHYLFRLWEKGCEFIDRRRAMPQGHVPYSGSQWWTLTPAAVEIILEAMKDRELVAFYRTTLVPDEMMLHTILMNSERAEQVAHHNLRHIRWIGEGTPYTFTDDDFGELADSPDYFARKITISAAKDLVKQIDGTLL